MQENLRKKSNNLSFLVGLCVVAISWGMEAPAANAQEASQEPAKTRPVAAPTQSSAKRYFVEFRSRSALSYGHTFLVHGKLNGAGQLGKLTKDQVAGLHPATESSVPWMIGHLVPVISETGWSDGDIEDEYITARYRILLTKAEYDKVAAYIVKHQKSSPLWHAVLYNCNAWVADVAKFMGLKTPDSTLLYPEEYINDLAKLNGGKGQSVRATPARPAKPATQATAASPGTVQ